MDSSIDGVDVISSMPDEILQHILSFLLTRISIRTSALSRRWRHVWCETPCLHLISSVSRFHDVNQTLESYRGSKITSFNLVMIERVKNIPQIDNWIEFAMSRNVQKLSLSFCYYIKHDFQNLFYLSSSLVQLSVRANFPMNPTYTVSWKSLRKLRLNMQTLDDESIANILSGCPILEILELFYSRLELLDLTKSPSLRRLVIERHFRIKRPMEIVAPHIHYLKLTVPQQSLCTLVDVSSLTEASLHVLFNRDHSLMQNQNMVLKMLAKLQNVKRLSFTGTVLQILSLAELHGVPFPTLKVQTLTIKTRFARSVIPGIARLLQNSPDLKKLIAQATYSDCIELYSSYFALQGLNPDQCWRSNYEAFPTSYEFRSMLHYKDATLKLMASFMEMVLRNVKTLETLVVGFENIFDFDKEIYEELLQMPPTLCNNNNVSIVLKR